MAGGAAPHAIAELSDLYGVVELWVALHQFINVQMQCQGWYAVRIRLAASPRIKAVFPFLNKLGMEDDEDAPADPDTKAMQPVQEKGWSWRSRVFNIKHVLESVDMLDPAPCFQVFVRDPADIQAVTFTVQLELLAQTLDPDQESVPFSASKLKVVATEELRVTGAHCHVLGYHAATWGPHNMAMGHVMLGSCLVGWATRASVHRMGQAVRRDLRQPTRARMGSYVLTKGSPTLQQRPHSNEGTPSTSTPLSPHPLANAGSLDPFAAPDFFGSGDDGAGNANPLAAGRPLSFGPFKTMTPQAHPPALGGGGGAGAGAQHGGWRGGGATSSAAALTLPEFIQAALAPALTTDKQQPQQHPHPQQPQLPAAFCDRLEALWRALALPLARGNDAVVATLTRALPRACFSPQSYGELRAMLAELPAMSHKAFQAAQRTAWLSVGSAPKTPRGRFALGGFSSIKRGGGDGSANGSVTVGGGVASPPASQQRAAAAASQPGPQPSTPSAQYVEADVAAWMHAVPQALVPALPPNCTPAVAMLYLHVALSRLMHAATVDCTVIQWLVRFSPHELAKALRAQWEAEQPVHAAPWVKLESELQLRKSRPDSGNTMHVFRACAVAPHAQQAAMQDMAAFRPPQIARTAQWDAPGQQPVLYVDDSLAPDLADAHAFLIKRTKQPGSPYHAATPGGRSRQLLLGDGAGDGGSARVVDPSGLSIRVHDGDDGAGSSGAKAGGSGDEVHLVVFVHGFKGAPTDLDMVKAHLHILHGGLECRFSAANEDKTSEGLEALGGTLADEVVGWARQLQARGRPPGKLSFVAHSMGALIVRSALANPKMEELLPRLWLFLSIAGPHLGQLYSSNGLLSMGVGVLKMVQKGSLQQLDLSDGRDHDAASSWLYRLATRPPGAGGSLQAFKRVVLVACDQDRYVPSHSAELSWCEAALKDRSWRGKAYADMLSASMLGFGATKGGPQLLRVAVHFPALGASLLGRAGHLALIERDDVARSLAWGVVHRFDLLGSNAQPGWL